ncbi:Hypothetical protein RG1141_CH15880 [Neorhizobium galegae bv. officinalis bv. officinalis str. HAMBI 1141]|uniref:UvrD-like helicase ATP-binding domain-containing protein n=1 Tax=Neorhizobium galegae bv. officinalis bv. officinalis str. HAMBI 1141 TaxID=1028801 RepID=A0A068T7C0_NEOGA|nr:UvrD-helicase domain-containing protein [Neorhizobium galegae]CDN53931.1 Hypothetical protein RG1141_CH15880 [Neorhizobium galegae bv. officinalis bv. officinalis str. HAMBI 1141]
MPDLNIAIEENAARIIARSPVSESFFKSFTLCEPNSGLASVTLGNTIFVLCRNSKLEGRFIVINGARCALSNAKPNSYDPFERIITLAISKFENDVSLPVKWGLYTDGGKRGSFFAYTAAKGSGARIFYEDRFNGGQHIYVYAINSKNIEFSNVVIEKVPYDEFNNNIVDAFIKYESLDFKKKDFDGLVEIEPPSNVIGHGWSLEEWVDRRLTNAQRIFLNKDYSQSVRLRGAAGTGKTISLIVKFLRDFISFEADHKNIRMLFLTHSKVTADLVKDLIHQLDKEDARGRAMFASAKVATIFEIASDFVQREQRGVSPIDIDAYSGRIMQRELVESIITSARLTLATQFADESSPDFINRMLTDEPAAKDRFLYEVMNEIMAVLDAEGIRSGNSKATDYINAPRPEWMVSLEKSGERKILLDIHRRYREQLREMRVISVDQLVADFVSFLSSNVWDNLMEREGYDALFVDELHLFTPLERMALKPLMRQTGVFGGRQPMFMAYDLKQTTRDYFSSLVTDGKSTSSWIGRTADGSDLVELNEVFRFTPQIAHCIADMAVSFAEVEFLDQMDRHIGESLVDDGDVPELREFNTNQKMYEWAFAYAHGRASSLGSGRRVCIICMNEILYAVYRDAGRHSGEFISIESREDLNGIRYAGKRFIYSSPEFVSGLQFDDVIVIHADRRTVDENDLGPLRRRRNLSRLYLAASRASKRLTFCASLELGGISPIFTTAIAKHTIHLAG